MVGKKNLSINSAFRDARKEARGCDAFNVMDPHDRAPASGLLERMDDYVRREPTKALVTTFGFGFLLNILPLGAIASALVSIALMLARPVLLFLGLVKACECCGCQPIHHSKI